MNKTLFAVFCIMAVAVSIRVAHFEDSTTPVVATTTTVSTTTPTTTTPGADQPLDQEAVQAFTRFADFIQKDKSLSKAMASGKQPNEKQLKKIMAWMTNDPYFQNEILNAIKSTEENKWVGNLSKPAQIRYLRIITSITEKDTQNPKKMKNVIQKLLRDQEIGAALKAQFGSDITPEVLEQAFSAAGGAASPAHQFIKSMF